MNNDNTVIQKIGIQHFISDWSKVRFKEVSFTVTSGSSEEKELPLERDVNKIIAFQIYCNEEKQAYDRGRFKMTVDNQDIIPSDFPARFFMAGHACPPEERFFVLNMEVSSDIKIRYSDTSHPTTSFASNTVRVIAIVEYK